MAIQQIEYEDKVALNVDIGVPDKNKCKADDMNEIKNVVNNNSYETPKVSSQVDTDYKVNVLTTKNLFDKNSNIISGYYYNDTTGEITTTGTANNYLQETYIKVKPNTEYTISAESGSQYLRIVEYNSSKTYIKTTNSGGSVNTKTITTTANTEYVRLSMNGSNVLNTLIFNEGTNTTYEPFIPNTINVNNEKYTDTINIGTEINTKNRMNVLCSKNLFDKDNANVLDGYFDAGQIYGSGTNKIVYVSCQPNTTYTISKILGSRFQVAYTSSTPTINGSITGTLAYNDRTEISITTNDSAKYLVVYCWRDGETNTFDEVKASLQIEKNSTATTYEPYITPSINIDGNEIYSKASNEYTTSEQVIGRWINSKPIYRKVVEFGTLPNTSTKNVAHNISNVDRWVNVSAIAENVAKGCLPIPYVSSPITNGVALALTSTNITITTYSDRTYFDSCYVILEYTKTAD